VPPEMVPSATPIAPRHISMVMPVKIRPMTMAVIAARNLIRRFAVSKVFSTAPRNRSCSRSCCPKAWTIFMAPNVSAIIAPTSATRSWLERETLVSLRPMKTIGSTMTGIASSRPAVRAGARVNR